MWQTMRTCFYVGLLLGLVPAALGVYIVLRRVVFVGVVLAEFSAVGVAVALAYSLPHGAFALGFALVGVVVLSQAAGRGVLPTESLVGLSYAAAAALALLVVYKLSHAGAEEVHKLLWADVLAVAPKDLLLMAAAFAAAALAWLLGGKELLFTGFDAEMAAAAGYRTPAWDLLFYGLVGVVAASAIRTAGVLVVFGFMVLPAAAALQLARSLRTALLLAVCFGVVSGAAGVVASWFADAPTGPMMVACAFALFLMASVTRLVARVR